MININTLLADKYKNMSLPCAFYNTFVGMGCRWIVGGCLINAYKTVFGKMLKDLLFNEQ